MEQKNDKVVINRTTMIVVGVIAGILLIMSFVVVDWIVSRQGTREEKVKRIDGFSSEIKDLDSELFGGDGLNPDK
ncbi:hypothetical protein IIY59_02025 [Candidatus Saccharibacteria bacterium]|nr:hypothetical protein [Candidatus Saccharibacteria bacterium]